MISVVVSISILAFGDVGEKTGATFATNGGGSALSLTVGNTATYNGAPAPTMTWAVKDLVPSVDRFFSFDDVKPGDQGESTMTLKIKNGPAYACLDFKNLTDSENGVNAPESLVDPDGVLSGELSRELQFFAWVDDGDMRYETDERALFGTSSKKASDVLNGRSYAIADVDHGTPIAKNGTAQVGIVWCAGELSVDTGAGTFSCDGSLMDNRSQSDEMRVDIALRAVKSADQPEFSCVREVEPPHHSGCEIEGHKYDENGKPLKGWTIGLMKTITHNRGEDIYDLATDVTDKDGYYCLEWDGETRTPRNTPSYKKGPYHFTYSVYEIMKPNWEVLSVEKGKDVPSLTPVTPPEISYDMPYVSVQMGETDGYIFADAEYHIDFYNQKKGGKAKAQSWTQTNVKSENVLTQSVKKIKNKLRL